MPNTLSPIEEFKQEVRANIEALSRDCALQGLSNTWIRESARLRYSYNFSWLGRPIIQLPQDIIALQEIIFKTQPDLIIETGIAHGGSLIFHASMLELCGGDGQVLGIDIDIRRHNRAEIENHRMFKRITMIEGSSVDEDIVQRVRELASGRKRVMVILDSNHTHDHVLRELRAYSPLVTKGNYLVVLDTVVEDLPEELWHERQWGKGNNPKTAVLEFLGASDRFEIDKEIPAKLVITSAPDGYLRCVRD